MRFLFVLALLTTAGPVTIPDTPAGRIFSAWLTALNAADRTRLEAVFKQFVEPRSVEDALDFRQRTGGGLDLRKVLESTPTRITAWLESRAGTRSEKPESSSSLRRPSACGASTCARSPRRWSWRRRGCRWERHCA